MPTLDAGGPPRIVQEGRSRDDDAAMADAAAEPAAARRRCDDDDGGAETPPPTLVSIEDLPDAVFSKIASYLYLMPQALFAAALTASPGGWRRSRWKMVPTDASMAVISTRDDWSAKYTFTVYYKCEGDLVVKLSDEDVGGALACVNAVCGRSRRNKRK